MGIVALSRYLKAVTKLLTGTERAAMETSLLSDPTAHPIMARTGGFRKARWGRGNSGKSGGVRTIYYYFVTGETIYLFDMYAKNQKETLTHAEENYLRQFAEGLEKHKQ